MKKNFLLQLIIFIFLCASSYAQNYSSLKKTFEGEWICKETGRHLTISFEDSSYIIINDWKGKNRRKNADAYSATIENGKLILPRDTEEHKALYCELSAAENKLHYRCENYIVGSKNENSATGNTIHQFANDIIFLRVKTK